MKSTVFLVVLVFGLLVSVQNGEAVLKCSEQDPPGTCPFNGTCNELTDECEYPEGMCGDDSYCTSPPADYCDGNIAKKYSANGTCNAGICEYTSEDTNCDDKGLGCSAGNCEEPACEEDWTCTKWSPSKCPVEGQQTRTCTDSNSCGTEKNKPPEVRECNFEGYICEETYKGIVITNPNGSKKEMLNKCDGNIAVQYNCSQKASLNEKLLVGEYREGCEFGYKCKTGFCRRVVVKRVERVENNQRRVYYCKGFEGDNEGDKFELQDPRYFEIKRTDSNCVPAERGGCFEISSEGREGVLQFSSSGIVKRWDTKDIKWRCDGNQVVAISKGRNSEQETVFEQDKQDRNRITKLISAIRSFNLFAFIELFISYLVEI